MAQPRPLANGGERVAVADGGVRNVMVKLAGTEALGNWFKGCPARSRMDWPERVRR